ncbi:MAG TPA: tyrosine-type recombinase/integrase [Solirubrobacteraceae bacterium]
MSALAPILQAFFIDRLIAQRRASPHTITSYRNTMRLLLEFAQARLRTPAAQLDLGQLDADLITAFLEHLEHDRQNSVGTRNTRLAAIRSLYTFASLRHPEHAALIARVLAIPTKRHDRTLITHLTDNEINALLSAPDQRTWIGRRDRAMLALAIETGLRVSELTDLTCGDTHLSGVAHIACHGKGRKQRVTPLTKPTAAVLRSWLAERGGLAADPLFPTSRGKPLTRDAVARRLAKHAITATHVCPTLHGKNVTPHVLRHTAAMRLLHAGVDTAVIALWLGHESVETTHIYLHADLAIKERAIARTKPSTIKPGRYKPSDALMAFLDKL